MAESQTTTEPTATMPAAELFALHPLPWTHHLLLIKDANGKQVIHTGGLYSEGGRLHQGPYLSGLNALLVELVNSRVSASVAPGVANLEAWTSIDGWLRENPNATAAECLAELVKRIKVESAPTVAPQEQTMRSNHFDGAAIERGFPSHISKDGTAYYRDGTVLQPRDAPASPAAPTSSDAWATWFDRLGKKASAEVVNATAELVTNERLAALVQANCFSTEGEDTK